MSLFVYSMGIEKSDTQILAMNATVDESIT